MSTYNNILPINIKHSSKGQKIGIYKGSGAITQLRYWRHRKYKKGLHVNAGKNAVKPDT
jgi:hypothetical protein